MKQMERQVLRIESNVLVDFQCLEHFFTFGTIMSVEEIEPIFLNQTFFNFDPKYLLVPFYCK